MNINESHYDYEINNPGILIFRMSGFTPPLEYDFALWYTINFYCTIAGFIIEFLFLLAILSNMIKERSKFDFFNLLFSITKVFDMMRFFLPASHGFSPSLLFSREAANSLRSIYIVYSFFIMTFFPTCQLILCINKFTFLTVPKKHKKVNF